MTLAEVITLLPYLVLAGGSVVVLLVMAFNRSHQITASLSALTLIAAILTIPFAADSVPQHVTPLLYVDLFGLFFTGIIMGAALFVVLINFYPLEIYNQRKEEFYILLLIATFGSTILTISQHFASFFLGLETLSVSLYGMIAYLRKSPLGLEAGIKYVILAAVSSAFMLFGLALIYASNGSMDLLELSDIIVYGTAGINALWLTGLAMILIGIGFKLAVVPFHLWTPDIYQGASAPVTAFVATVSKGGVFALLMRYFFDVDASTSPNVATAIGFIAIASMFIGNLLALLQNNVKRILAYSSIAHFGYLLITILANEHLAVVAGVFYIIAYIVTILLAFGIITTFSGGGEERDDLDDYKGLFWRRPWLASLFTLALLSLAGIPLTGGFIGKFFILAAGVSSSAWILVLSLIISSSIGLFYYLRIIVTMTLTVDQKRISTWRAPFSWSGSFALAILSVMLIWLGIFPSLWIFWIENLTANILM